VSSVTQVPTEQHNGAPAVAAAQPVAGWSPADPGPLGLAAFALTTFVLSVFNAGLVSSAGTPVVLGLALFYGGIVQLLAGMWEFRTGNTFGAVAFCSYAGFWLSLWALEHFYAAKIPATHASDAIAVFLFGWAIFTAFMWAASLRTNGVLVVAFTLLTATFVLLALGESGPSTSLHKAGGWVGLATAAAAWYGSFAAVINSTFGRVVLPVMPLKR
jgi:uncharacterized protein